MFTPPNYERLVTRPRRMRNALRPALLLCASLLALMAIAAAAFHDVDTAPTAPIDASTGDGSLELASGSLVRGEPFDGMLRTIAGEFLFARARFVAEVEWQPAGPVVAVTLTDGHGSFVGVPPTVLALGVRHRFVAGADAAHAVDLAALMESQPAHVERTPSRREVESQQQPPARRVHLLAILTDSDTPRPLADVPIRVRYTDGVDDAEHGFVVRSDHGGRVTADLPAGASNVRLLAHPEPGSPYACVPVDLGPAAGWLPEMPLYVRFFARKPIVGRTIDDAGRAVSGVTVLWRHVEDTGGGDMELGTPQAPTPGTQFVTSDANGRFQIEAAFHQLVLRAHGPGLASEAYLLWVPKVDELDLRVSPTRSLQGHLFLPSQEPAHEGWVKVRVAVERVPPVQTLMYEVRTSAVGPDGSFQFDGLLPSRAARDRVGVLAGAPGMPTWRKLVALQTQTTTQQIQLTAPNRLRGRVLGVDDRPIQGVEVVASIPRTQPVQVVGRMRTDPAGNFELSRLPHVELTLDLRPPPGSNWQGKRVLGVRVGENSPRIDFRLPRQEPLEGIVVDEHGVPMGQALLTARLDRAEDPQAPDHVESTLTAADGRFRFEQLVAGQYRIIVRGRYQPIEVRTGTGPLRLVAQRSTPSSTIPPARSNR